MSITASPAENSPVQLILPTGTHGDDDDDESTISPGEYRLLIGDTEIHGAHLIEGKPDDLRAFAARVQRAVEQLPPTHCERVEASQPSWHATTAQ